MEPIPESTERTAREVVDAAITVHRALGPGLLESVYEVCLCPELAARGIPFERQVAIPILYRNVRLESGLQLDLVVQATVVVELKAVEELLPVHDAQILSYLKLANLRLGFLVNFNVPLLKDGLRRFIR